MLNRYNKELNNAQTAFTEALISMLHETPYAKISISGLSQHADYDRRTFYRYFKSIDDVLCLYCANLLREMATIMNEKGSLTPKSGFESYFEFWDRHKDFLLILNKQGLLHYLGDLQTQLIYQQVGLLTQDNLPAYFEEIPEYSQFAFYFMLGGVWGTLSFWISSGMKQTPQEITEHILNSLSQMSLLIK